MPELISQIRACIDSIDKSLNNDEVPPVGELEDTIHELSQLQVNATDLHLNCVLLDLVIEINPNDADPWEGKGNALYGLGKYKEAKQAWHVWSNMR